MDALLYFFSAISGGLVTAPIAIWISKKIIDAKLNRDLEKYKTQLKGEADRELELLKSSLQGSLKQREIAISWLHQKQADFVIDLYVSLVDLQKLSDFAFGFQSSREPELIRKNTHEVFSKIQVVYSDYKKARIFLTKSSCHKIESVLHAIEDPTTTYLSFLSVYDDHELHTLSDVRQEEWQKLRDTLPLAMNQIEEDFRSLLGVSS